MMREPIKVERSGARVYFAGDTYAIKDRIKAMGGHWDGDRRAWWVGVAKLAAAEGGARSATLTALTASRVRNAEEKALMSDRRKRPEVESAIDDLRAKTPCSRCGGGPIEWHGEHHPANPGRRIANMVGAGYKLPDVLAEIALCEPLCRSCHMAGDGRTAALLAATPSQKGAVLVGPSPCVECGRSAKPLRRGLCGRCRDRKRRPPGTGHLRSH